MNVHSTVSSTKSVHFASSIHNRFSLLFSQHRGNLKRKCLNDRQYTLYRTLQSNRIRVHCCLDRLRPADLSRSFDAIKA
ncbi:hypothetical protein BpHYR1_040383 [Brachionus plicatilis]|uniref:Uncharacterized protein n=1 Tax=Brachionus plicatilis TaxID=10195 RepID=A0A3M7QY62_BRAPC|nr:hypothetical protein BpHYR1_040383 [Brachionus plicatilis]